MATENQWGNWLTPVNIKNDH